MREERSKHGSRASGGVSVGTHRTNETFLFHDLQIDSVEWFEVIQEHHIKLQRFRHIQRLSKVLQTRSRAARYDLSVSSTSSKHAVKLTRVALSTPARVNAP